MALFRNIVFAAALAGLIAGVFVTVVHKIGTVPIILKAETYERVAEANPLRPPARMPQRRSTTTMPKPGRPRTASSGPPSPYWRTF